MKQNIFLSICKIVRNSFFNIVNKEFLIFLFFLALSGLFWLLLALNDTYELEIRIPLRIVNVPKNVVLTSEASDTLRINVRDKGYTLCTYLYVDQMKSVDVQFSSYIKKKGYGSLSATELSKLAYQSLYSSTRILTVKPEKFEYFYNYGMHKRVPVKLFGRLLPAESYYLARMEFSPSMVDVYGSQQLLDSVKWVYTERVNMRHIKDTVSMSVALNSVKGMKCVPSTVKVSIFPDILTEESVEVPITAVNMPDGKVLRTFPSRIKVTFTIGASLFRSISPDQFKVVVDYNDLVANPSEKCTLKIVAVPRYVKKVHTEVSQVDYLIEGQ